MKNNLIVKSILAMIVLSFSASTTKHEFRQLDTPNCTNDYNLLFKDPMDSTGLRSYSVRVCDTIWRYSTFNDDGSLRSIGANIDVPISAITVNDDKVWEIIDTSWGKSLRYGMHHFFGSDGQLDSMGEYSIENTVIKVIERIDTNGKRSPILAPRFIERIVQPKVGVWHYRTDDSTWTEVYPNSP